MVSDHASTRSAPRESRVTGSTLQSESTLPSPSPGCVCVCVFLTKNNLKKKETQMMPV